MSKLMVILFLFLGGRSWSQQIVDSVIFRFANGDIKYYIVSSTTKPLYQPLPSTLLMGTVPFANGGRSGSAATPATTGSMTISMTTAIVTITPTGACTFNASGGTVGQIVTFSITTSGTSSFVLTFGSNFKAAGTLATGTSNNKKFSISFVCIDGVLWQEIGRTPAM